MAKSYEQNGCPVAHTMDLIGERWTILILRDLVLHGPRGFQDFQESLAGAAPNTISSRLKDLESNGLVERRVYSGQPPRLGCQREEKGKRLPPVVKGLRA